MQNRHDSILPRIIPVKDVAILSPVFFFVLFSLASGQAASTPAVKKTATPTIIKRAEWDSSPPKLRGVLRYPKLAFDWLVIHHSDFSDTPGPVGIRDYHRNVNGWSDIGYHYVISKEGIIYEGRDIHHMGAHAGQSLNANAGVRAARRKGKSVAVARKMDPDYGAIGIVLDGYFREHDPPSVQTEALEALVGHLRELYSIDGQHIVTHREVKSRIVEGSGYTFTGPQSDCPGDALQRFVDALRWRIGEPKK